MEDVEEALAGGQAVIRVDSLHPSHREEHPNGRPKGKEDGRLVEQLRVVGRDLQREGRVGFVS